ncbi:response regulator [Sphingomicrobium sp. XHP0239]|uniref:response regulator n=1 Tax=Sphingomicrobium maritimum TaxID=3133972 RepID=UPI0031CC8137
MTREAPFKIILVEDEVLIAMDLEQEFASMGVDVVGTAGTLSEAKQLAGQADYDVAVFDIDLQGEDVFPAAEIARHRGHGFVFFSGHADRGRLDKTFPGVPLVQKPATANQIYDALKAVA